MNSLYKCSFLFLVLTITQSAYGQNESYPCKSGNTNLKSLFKGDTLKNLLVHDCRGSGLHDLSSSFLKPEGTPPKINEDPDGGAPDDAEYVNWTCKYSMGNISDGNPKTAWVEGVDGPGIGEVIVVPCLDLTKPVKIWAGYGKSAASYSSNNRPQKIRVVIIKAELYGAPQNGYIYENLTIISEKVVSLEDKNNYQSLFVPEYEPESYFSVRFDSQTDYKYFLGIEILSVFPGSKYNDTCISEIVNE